MDAAAYTELIKTLGDVRTAVLWFLLAVAALYAISSLVKAWWRVSEKHGAEAREREREEKLGTRLDTMNDRYMQTYETVIKDNTQALKDNTESLARFGGSLGSFAVILQDCPGRTNMRRMDIGNMEEKEQR